MDSRDRISYSQDMVEDVVEDLEALREVVMKHFLLFFKESVGIGKSALFRVE